MKFSIRRFNEWLIVVLLIILVPALFWLIEDFLPRHFNYLFNPDSTSVLIGLASVDAIDMFRGDDPAGFSLTRETVSIYVNVLIYLMLGPYLFLMGYIKAKKTERRTKPWYWYAGAVICIGSLSIIPTEILKQYVFENTKASAADSRTKDLMRAELAEVGFATAQYEILEDGVDELFSVDELNLENLKYNYTVESIQLDTLITLMVSNPDLPDYNVKMEVRPYNRSLLKQRN
ncbi:hypothetical protein [Gracilimonas sp.]|uniref:hypothetical protein n=1 Tax=Gracilimonas sp. TaxID=1974203 RepID=UPI0032EC66BB